MSSSNSAEQTHEMIAQIVKREVTELYSIARTLSDEEVKRLKELAQINKLLPRGTKDEDLSDIDSDTLTALVKNVSI